MRVRNAFVVTGDTIHVVPGDSLQGPFIYKLGGYTPHFWRRPRLAFARPVVRRYLVCRALWRWLP